MKRKDLNIDISQVRHFVNINVLKNVIFFSGGTIVFILGMVVYGIILNYREVPLKQLMKEKKITVFENPNLIIDRKSYSLQLFDDTILVKTYRANFGRNIQSPKLLASDGATPVGEYKVCSLDTSENFHRIIKINYPNINDAIDALRKNYITQKEFDSIKYQNEYEECPQPHYVMGGNMGIQGIGRFDFIFRNLPFNFNWTDGNVAVSNEDIDELFLVMKKGAKIVIK